MTLPALIARPWVSGFSGLVAVSAVIGGLFAALAGWLSAGALPLPTGALVIVSLGLGWAVSFVLAHTMQAHRVTHAD